MRHGVASERLRDSIAALTGWVANEHVPWAAIRALRACRLAALDKQPGVRPVGIGETISRLMSKVVLYLCGFQATDSAGNLNLCAGLPAGIEGAVHAMRVQTQRGNPEQGCQAQSETPGDKGTAGSGDEQSEEPILQCHESEGAQSVDDEPSLDEPITQPEGDDLADLTPMDEMITQPEGDDLADLTPRVGQVSLGDCKDDDPDVACLVDARNGFNELNRKAMLWHVRHRWPMGARYAFNCYRYAAQLVVRRPQTSGYVILSKEGVTQGCPLAMLLYGLALVPLAEDLREEVPGVVQPWYADDAAMAGRASEVSLLMEALTRLGPKYGYFPEPDKSVLIVTERHEEAARCRLSRFPFKYKRGTRYLGSFIGADGERGSWLEPKIQRWVEGVKAMGRVAGRYPQAAYAGMTKSLQCEWQYLQRVLPGVSDAFKPVEEALVTHFLPSLLGQDAVPKGLRERLRLPVRNGGLGIPNPCETSDALFEASEKMTETLTTSLLDMPDDFDVKEYILRSREVRQHCRNMRQAATDAEMEKYVSASSAEEARLTKRSGETGVWLTTIPNTLNGNVLSKEEFRDSLRLRFGLGVENLPSKCDGCGAAFNVTHALNCKLGGLVSRRHHDVNRTFQHLCCQAFTPSSVSCEPLIQSNMDKRRAGGGPGGVTRDQLETLEDRGDTGVHSFWTKGSTCIFDVRVTNLDNASQVKHDPASCLRAHEKAKMRKYNKACLERRKTFTPLVFSCDGMKGPQAKAALKRLAKELSEKWELPYSQVCNYVNSQMAVALVRATSTCLRAATTAPERPSGPNWTGMGLELYS